MKRNYRNVSIPFKRETAFKQPVQTPTMITTMSFNSLQTGNCIQTENGSFATPLSDVFQFPSNGKLHSNRRAEGGTPV